MAESNRLVASMAACKVSSETSHFSDLSSTYKPMLAQKGAI